MVAWPGDGPSMADVSEPSTSHQSVGPALTLEQQKCSDSSGKKSPSFSGAVYPSAGGPGLGLGLRSHPEKPGWPEVRRGEVKLGEVR